MTNDGVPVSAGLASANSRVSTCCPNGRRSQTIASVCLAAALLGLSGVATWSGLATSAAASSSQHSVFLYDAYTTARYWVETEESSDSQYQLAPDANTSAAFDEAQTDVDTAMATVTVRGTPAERAVAASIVKRNDLYAQVACRTVSSR